MSPAARQEKSRYFYRLGLDGGYHPTDFGLTGPNAHIVVHKPDFVKSAIVLNDEIFVAVPECYITGITGLCASYTAEIR